MWKKLVDLLVDPEQLGVTKFVEYKSKQKGPNVTFSFRHNPLLKGVQI